MIAMYGHVTPFTGAGVNEKAYAARCVGGDLPAGMRLVDLLWTKGHDPDIRHLLSLAFPKGEISQAGFDNLADALAEAKRHREFRRVMKEGGVEDKDPPPDQPESDLWVRLGSTSTTTTG